MTEALLTVRELAIHLNVPVSWIYQRTRPGGLRGLPHYKIGKYVRFRISEVEEYLSAIRVGGHLPGRQL